MTFGSYLLVRADYAQRHGESLTHGYDPGHGAEPLVDLLKELAPAAFVEIDLRDVHRQVQNVICAVAQIQLLRFVQAAHEKSRDNQQQQRTRELRDHQCASYNMAAATV